MSQLLIEENGIYGLDCTNADWATSEINTCYHNAGVCILSDADYVIETRNQLIIVEYKNALVSTATRPESFRPLEDKKVNSVIRKYYDTLHYLTLIQKTGPKRYVYVVEALHSDSTMRRRLRERLKRELPFQLQHNVNSGIKLIEEVEVLSIAEWNDHDMYKDFPFVELSD